MTVLVDFENDSVRTALDVAHALGPRLWGVRLDTSESLVDRSLWEELGDFQPTGVNPQLVWKVREALDGAGFDQVSIVVSGGFTVDKIREFEAHGVPVDAYGVGLVADPRLERLHRRHRAHRRTAVREVRAQSAVEPAPRARSREPAFSGTSTRRSTSSTPTASWLFRDADSMRWPRWRSSCTAGRAAGIPHVASADDHELTDAEISEAPDFARRIRRTACAARAARRRSPRRSRTIRSRSRSPTCRSAGFEGREFLLLKKRFDVFTNPNADRVLDLLDPAEVIVFGVATDVCDEPRSAGCSRAAGR